MDRPREEQRATLSLAHRVRWPTTPSPAGRPPLLVLLHGVGSNELAMAAIAGRFDPRFLVVSPRAPIELNPVAFAWFHVRFTPDGPVIDGDELRAAWATAGQFIVEAAAAYDAEPGHIVAAGFSQGGIVATATLLIRPELLAGAVCMSGRLPPEVLPDVASDARLSNKRLLLIHGTRDQTLPIAHGRAAAERLQATALAVDYREFDMGHTTTEESLAAVDAWLAARLDA